mmetsp:Transcript_9561/g.16767  ORF Transcript_9561/g.16767 Transcript_9561/m.16767 type:complete len:235 (-) Transcript_9561:133-837(-)
MPRYTVVPIAPRVHLCTRFARQSCRVTLYTSATNEHYGVAAATGHLKYCLFLKGLDTLWFATTILRPVPQFTVHSAAPSIQFAIDGHGRRMVRPASDLHNGLGRDGAHKHRFMLPPVVLVPQPTVVTSAPCVHLAVPRQHYRVPRPAHHLRYLLIRQRFDQPRPKLMAPIPQSQLTVLPATPRVNLYCLSHSAAPRSADALRAADSSPRAACIVAHEANSRFPHPRQDPRECRP